MCPFPAKDVKYLVCLPQTLFSFHCDPGSFHVKITASHEGSQSYHVEKRLTGNIYRDRTSLKQSFTVFNCCDLGPMCKSSWLFTSMSLPSPYCIHLANPHPR